MRGGIVCPTKLDGLVEAALARFLAVDPASEKARVIARMMR
jgi:hypothetical protein